MADIQKLLCNHLRRELSNAPSAPLPAGGNLLWQWFCDLHATRTYGFSGPDPIRFSEFVSYRAIIAREMEPKHVAIIRAMDSVYLECAYSKGNKPGNSKTSTQITAVTPEKFDAMFG